MRKQAIVWVSGLLLASLVSAGVAAAPAARRAAERARLTNYPLNRHIRMLDGQWQGTFLASDGNVYVGGGSHRPDLGAALFRYRPETRALELLVRNITPICGEDQTKTPPQGKIHSPVVEHRGWIHVPSMSDACAAHIVARFLDGETPATSPDC